MSLDLIDLYSDTKTRPSPGMREAMANACVGDEQADEDPTTLELCSRVAKLLGYTDALLLPSGTMCNLVSILCHTRPGDELICDEQSHIYCTEAAGAAALAGVSIRALASPHGIFSATQVGLALRAKTLTAPRSALLCVEQTTNFSGGAIWPLEQLREVRDTAKAAGLRCHMDGARLLNACAATGITARQYTAGWDSAWLDLSKGLGCPVGAVLCGGAEFIAAARQWKYRLGGAMRQSGVLAAAGLYALDYHLPQLALDHKNALLIRACLHNHPSVRFDPPQPATNILRFEFCDSRISAEQFADLCLARGVRVRPIGGNFIRITTHMDVSPAAAQQAGEIMQAILRHLEAQS
jgi:threonine aldolase